MVERSIDKKIRTLREILEAPTDERLDSEGNPHPCKYLNTYAIKIPYKLLMNILSELKLVVSMADNIPLYDDDLEMTLGNTDDYLLEIIVEKEDTERLSALLKEYESKFPKRQKPIIREKTLELIAKEIGNLDTGDNLVKFLENYGVDKELIVYPNTKWRMVFDVISYLAYSDKKEDQETLSRIIGEATHPLMHNGDASSAEALRSEFNNYLSYDKMGIAYKEDDGTYWALPQAKDDEIQTEAFDLQMELEEQEKKQLEFLCRPENKEKISLLKKVYQSLINVVEVFCENPSKPTSELNNAYQFLNRLVWETINNLGLRGNAIRNFNNYASPFVNLFAAEKHYREQKRVLSWQKIRPEMNAMYGDIEELYQEVNGSDILAEPDQQKKLNDIQLYLSELKEKTKETKKSEETKELPATKIEITGMPELKIKGLEKISQKKKKQAGEELLYLNRIGDLYREPKEKYCYSVGEKSDRHKIVRHLVENRGYQQTKHISFALEGKDEQTIRKEIRKINENFMEFLKIKKDKFIDSRKGSGYRISPKYKIILKT